MQDPARAPDADFDELVFAALERLEASGDTGLSEFCAEHPAQATEIRRRVGTLVGAGLLQSERVRDRPRLERLGEFQIQEQLGQGGMGVVYRAVQVGLGREVAVKVVRPEHLYFPGARERFRREVETVAQLQHPGIVSVYSVGEENGVPYFAMELVRGESLDALLTRLQGRSAAQLDGKDLDPSAGRGGYLFAGTWEEACLRVLRQVCEALEFAHQNGVLHRDIKPSNIMLSTEGASRALLLDFGLATGRGSTKLTRTSSQLGSLRYMAPEALRSSAEALAATTDVYGLGVTLYEMLSLRRAFDGESDAAVMLAVEQGDFPALRRVNPAISWETQTICATAMERDPKRRYQRAADLGRDIANALEHRPIEARRAGVVLRLRRWAQRRPAMATAVTLGLVGVIALPTTVAWQQHRAAKRLAVERDRARESFASAMKAIDTMLSRVGDVDLRFVPAMEPLRRRLLEDAVTLVQRVVERGQGDQSSLGQVELARAHSRLGNLLRNLGRNTEAVGSLRQSVEAWSALTANGQLDPTQQQEVWRARTLLAEVTRMSGDLNGARDALAALEGELRPLATSDAVSAANRIAYVECAILLGAIFDSLGDESNAVTFMERGTQVADQLLSENPDSLDALRAAANAWNEHGARVMVRAAQQTERNTQAEAALERAVDLQRRVVEHPGCEPKDRSELIDSLINLGGVPNRGQDFAAARVFYDEARELSAKLVAEFPNTPAYKLQLATAYNQIGNVLDKQRAAGQARMQDVADAYSSTVDWLTQVVDAAPDEPIYRARLSTALYNLSGQERFLTNYDEAKRLLLASLEHIRKVRAQAPDNQDYQNSHIAVLGACWSFDRTSDHVYIASWADRFAQELPENGLAFHRAAFAFVRCFELAGTDEALDDSARAALLEQYARRACEMYRGAVERRARYQTSAEIQKLKDPVPIHGTAAWRELLEWLDARDKR